LQLLSSGIGAALERRRREDWLTGPTLAPGRRSIERFLQRALD
jgi:hypothetical protein